MNYEAFTDCQNEFSADRSDYDPLDPGYRVGAAVGALGTCLNELDGLSEDFVTRRIMREDATTFRVYRARLAALLERIA